MFDPSVRQLRIRRVFESGTLGEKWTDHFGKPSCLRVEHAIIRNVNASKSRALLESLKRDILNGKYGSGQRFPSRRALAGRFGIAATTVQRALDELANQGLISRAKGSGSFVTKVGASRKLGLIVPGVAYSEFFSLVVGEISRCATRDGYVLLLGNMSSSCVSERIRRAKKFAKELVKEQVAGGIYQPFEFVENAERLNREIVSILDKAGVPVVLLSCDISAAQFKQTLEKAGLRVPNDVLLAGFNDLQMASLLTPPLTTIRQPCKEIGALAFRQLLMRLTDRETPPLEICLPAPLMERRSTRRTCC